MPQRLPHPLPRESRPRRLLDISHRLPSFLSRSIDLSLFVRPSRTCSSSCSERTSSSRAAPSLLHASSFLHQRAIRPTTCPGPTFTATVIPLWINDSPPVDPFCVSFTASVNSLCISFTASVSLCCVNFMTSISSACRHQPTASSFFFLFFLAQQKWRLSERVGAEDDSRWRCQAPRPPWP